MREFEFINKILNDHFRVTENEGEFMEELKDCQHLHHHRVKIITTRSISSLSLYRFDPDQYDFLPFFGRLSGLKRFCDYIMLVEANERLIIILIEMKRSKNDSKYKSQLDASRLFMNYVIANADRIKEENGYPYFDGDSITFRRVKIIDAPTNKLTTKPRLKVLIDGRDEYIILPLCRQFNPYWVI